MPVLRRLIVSLALVSITSACTPLETAAEPPSARSNAITTPGAPDARADAVDPETAPRSAGPISGAVIPQRAVLAGKPGTLDVMIRLTGEGNAGPRPPLDLAIVLDRSGSMGGEKMFAVKQAAIELVEELGPGDDITLVSYASDVTAHGRRRGANELGKAFLRKELLAIEATGGTALGPALFDGLAILQSAKRKDAALAHVMLLSDGMANEGETDPEIIAARARQAFGTGISTSTLGVGLDYNEDLMTKVADAGGGRYHFIESSNAVSRILADELAGLSSTVARGIELELRPTTGVEIERVYGYENSRDGAKVGALVGSLAAGQSRAILARIAYPAPSGTVLALGEFRIHFVDAETGVKGELTLHPKVPVVQTEAALERSENLEVTVRSAEIEANERLREAAAAIDESRFEDAKGTLNQAIDQLQRQNAATPSAELESQILEFEDALGDVDAASVNEDARKHSGKSFKSKAYKKSKK